MTTDQQIAVIGDGAMGSVCAIILANNGYHVRLWGGFPENIDDMRQRGENKKFLPGFKLPQQLHLTTKPAEALDSASLVISAVPCQYMRSVWQKLAPLQ